MIDPTLVRTAKEIIAGHQEEFIAWLRQVVDIPSVNPRYDAPATGEGAAQQALAALLRRAGVDVRLAEIARADLERYASDVTLSTSYVNRPNLYATLGASGPTLLLNSHIDVVGIAPDEQWTGDPFVSRVEDGSLIGRGAVDAKGSLVAMAAAMAVVRRLDIRTNRRVILTSVVDEEGGGGGTVATLADGIRAEGAIVGEPTRLRICPATRGHWMVRLVVPGWAAHPGLAHEGTNPIDKAYRYVQAAWETQARLDHDRPHVLWERAPVKHVFNVATFEAGRWGEAASVPAEARLEIMVGTVADEPLEEIRAAVDDAFTAVTKQDPWLSAHPPVIEWTKRRNHGSSTSLDSTVVRLITDAWSATTGAAPTIEGLSAVTDMRHLVRLGRVPTVNFGPGEMRRAHTADESLELEEYVRAIQVLSVAIAAWLTTPRA